MQEKENKDHVLDTQIFDGNPAGEKDLKRKLKRAGEVLQHMEEFERNFVHKLKNCLTPIKTCGELSLLDLKNDDPLDPLKQKIEKILESTRKVIDLADGWLLKLHFWLELESESLDETEGTRDMEGLLERGEEGGENQTNSEKRKYPRYLASLPFECCPIGSFTWGSGRIINVSKGGLMAAHSENFEIGQYLLLNIFFPLAHNSRHFKMIGQKVWGHGFAQDQGGYQFGIKLVDISSLGLERLGSLIKCSFTTLDRIGFRRDRRTYKA